MDKNGFLHDDLGGGFSLNYREAKNGRGGYHPVNMQLYRDGDFVRELTDRFGQFLDFPGIIHGAWEEDLTGALQPQVDFVAHVSRFQDGLARFSWMVQPDGFYYADEDSFGAEDDREVWLYALLDETGRFITPFSDVPRPEPPTV